MQDEPQKIPEFTNICGYTESDSKMALYIFLSITSLGILPLICLWKQLIFVQIARKKVYAFRDCTLVLLTSPDGSHNEVKVRKAQNLRYFMYKKLPYIYDESYSSFRVNQILYNKREPTCSYQLIFLKFMGCDLEKHLQNHNR